MEKVERTQYESVLAITGTLQGSKRRKLYEELGWVGAGTFSRLKITRLLHNLPPFRRTLPLDTRIAFSPT